MRVLTHGLSDQPSGRGKSERAGKVWEGHSGWRVWAQLLRVWRVPKCVLAVRLSTLSSNGFRVKGRTSKAEQRRAHRRGNCFSGGAFGYPRAAESSSRGGCKKPSGAAPWFFSPAVSDITASRGRVSYHFLRTVHVTEQGNQWLRNLTGENSMCLPTASAFLRQAR